MSDQPQHLQKVHGFFPEAELCLSFSAFYVEGWDLLNFVSFLICPVEKFCKHGISFWVERIPNVFVDGFFEDPEIVCCVFDRKVQKERKYLLRNFGRKFLMVWLSDEPAFFQVSTPNDAIKVV